MKKLLKIIFRLILAIVLIPLTGLLAIYVNYHLIAFSVHDSIFKTDKNIPFRKQALVMGAGNYEPDKWINHAFNHRMRTTVELFRNKKTGKIIVSGSNFPGNYNETAEMKMVLMEFGIPDTAIVSDYGGIRTWVSVQRAHEHYGADSLIIISQHDQLERALFIANCIGMDAIGLEAEPSPKYNRYWKFREYLARVKCTFDCLAFIFNIQ